MSQENVEIVRELFAFMARGDVDSIFDRYHPDIEWHDNDAWLDVGVHRGLEGVKAAWRPFLAEFELATFEPHDFLDAGDRVVVTVHTVARGRASGIPSEREVSMVWSLRDARVVRVDVFGDRARALEAGGL